MTELQNDRQDKNNMPPGLRARGHNKSRSAYSLKGALLLSDAVCHVLA
mgnify:CR=1 FL=1